VCELFDKCGASGFRTGLATPQPKISVFAECAPDRGQTFSIVRERHYRPIACGKTYATRRAVRDDVNRVESLPAVERCRHLPRRRLVGIEHDRVDLRPQVSKDHVKIGDGRIDEQNFRHASHDEVLSVQLQDGVLSVQLQVKSGAPTV
jgi:hypothetical protein